MEQTLAERCTLPSEAIAKHRAIFLQAPFSPSLSGLTRGNSDGKFEASDLCYSMRLSRGTNRGRAHERVHMLTQRIAKSVYSEYQAGPRSQSDYFLWLMQFQS